MKLETTPLVGVISSSDIVKSHPISDEQLKSMCHHEYFPNDRNRRWRYFPKIHEVRWTDDFEDEDELLVNEHLYKLNIEDPQHC
jgi:hypothetical protein